MLKLIVKPPDGCHLGQIENVSVKSAQLSTETLAPLHIAFVIAHHQLSFISGSWLWSRRKSIICAFLWFSFRYFLKYKSCLKSPFYYKPQTTLFFFSLFSTLTHTHSLLLLFHLYCNTPKTYKYGNRETSKSSPDSQMINACYCVFFPCWISSTERHLSSMAGVITFRLYRTASNSTELYAFTQLLCNSF